MSFSQYAATAIVPTLSRIVLCLAFVSVGWNKVFTEHEFTHEQAERLMQLGVRPVPVSPSMTSVHGGSGASSGSFSLASYRQDAVESSLAEAHADADVDDEAETAAAEVVTDQPEATESAQPDNSVADADTRDDDAAPASAPGTTYTAPAMHKITLLVDQVGWPQPVWMARLAAFTELVGGAMMLAGLFSRIWGLGLAITMGTAFYLVSMGANNVHQMHPFEFAQNVAAFNVAVSQLGLFVLAFGIFLTGPGPLSLDRMLFSRPPADDADLTD